VTVKRVFENMSKILSLEALENIANSTSHPGFILCFGHFNTIHPGHVRHFRNGKQHAGQLLVAVEGDAQMPEIERDQIFSEEERANAVAVVDLVDFVVILSDFSLRELVSRIKPSILMLGKEFERDNVRKVASAITALEGHGGRVIYDAGETHYASSYLFHNSLGQLETLRWREFQTAMQTQDVSLSHLVESLTKQPRNQILVLGDAIVDRYVACDPVGMSNEAPVVVVKELETRDYIGGAAIVAGHVKAFGSNCTFLSVVGEDKEGDFVENTLQKLGITTNLVRDPERPTTFKMRYMVENQKLFRVSRLKEHTVTSSVEAKLIDYLEDTAPSLDAIVVSDFVYGVVSEKILETISRLSSRYGIRLFGDVQCSSQIGNVTRLKGFDLICPTEREARIALVNHDDGIEYVANRLISDTRSGNMVMKLGGDGFIAYSTASERSIPRRQYFPALTANPVDVAGAGDSLLAAMAVGMTRGFTIMEAASLGACVTAIAVQNIGNRPVELSQVNEFIEKRCGISNEI
jgi:rfaE bifunctional protein kinase chain/domain